MKTKFKYISPTLECHDYQVENGFVNSLIIDPTDNGIENWVWEDGGDNGFNDDGDDGTGWTWD